MLAALSVASPDWWIGAALLFVSGFAAVWSAYRAGTSHRRAHLAKTLKLIAIALLALCLVEPVWSGFLAKPQANLFVVLVDNSRSLSVQSSTNETLAQSAKRLLTPTDDTNWLARLDQDFSLQRLAFDTRVRQVSDFEALEWSGDRSALKAALTELSKRFQGRPTGGLLLLSDGHPTDLSESELAALAAECKTLGPIFPVILPEAARLPDLTLENVTVSETSFEDAPVTVQCDARLVGMQSTAEVEISCQLLGPDGKVVEEQTLPVNGDKTVFRFQLRPTTSGLAFYDLKTSLTPKDRTKQKTFEESCVENNARKIAVNRGASRHRVLYLSGRPNWDFKFLRRAIDEDDLVDLVAMIRIAKREAKFDFRGRDGQSSNALFRGFKSDSDEETERYDEPVLVRLNTQNADELRAGFPKVAEELFVFDAIVLDDIEAGFFTRDQLTLLERFVSERGGGLMMVGGAESYSSGSYERSPIADILPVYLDRASYPDEDAQLRLDLTREGWLQTWTRLRSTEETERDRLHQMPPFATLNPVRGIKPGASVLATVSTSSGTRWPALVTQQFGRGHAAALLLGDLWRWQLQSDNEANADLAKAWRQTIRWLVADVPHRLQVRTESAPDFGADAVRLSVRAFDAEFRPLDNARVRLSVSPQKTGEQTETESKAVELDAESSDTESGLYSAIFTPPQRAGWSAKVQAQDGEGKELPVEETGWVHDPLSDELRALGIDSKFLTALATATGGRVVPESKLDDFVAGLKEQSMPVMQTWTRPLWDHPAAFAVILFCLVGEWALRRVNGLP